MCSWVFTWFIISFVFLKDQSLLVLIFSNEIYFSTDFSSLGLSEVKGEWIETIGEPVIVADFEEGMMVEETESGEWFKYNV